jgi:hypothetical protein
VITVQREFCARFRTAGGANHLHMSNVQYVAKSDLMKELHKYFAKTC